MTSPAGFSERVRKLRDRMDPCVLCPRACRVRRRQGRLGSCGIGDEPVVSSVVRHAGEESVLVGRGGSGTIFFAGCNLHCTFCQNYDISQHRTGRRTSVKQVARCMLDLQQVGCSNVNFVTPSHVAAPIAEAIELARADGLTLPTVYNCGGYDSVETLQLLEGLIDIYMPDMKYADPQVAEELSDAPDYPQVSFAAVREMHRQVGDLQLDHGLATRGLLVRHLVLPNGLAGTPAIVDFLADQISARTTINVMAQYRPCYHAHKHREINRRPTTDEITAARRYALKKGLNVLA